MCVYVLVMCLRVCTWMQRSAKTVPAKPAMMSSPMRRTCTTQGAHGLEVNPPIQLVRKKDRSPSPPTSLQVYALSTTPHACARTRYKRKRPTFLALGFTTVDPCDTCPSPIITTLDPFRTHRIVVACIVRASSPGLPVPLPW